MAKQYDNNMTGILSKNDKKETETHPDIKGSCEIEGVEYWMDGWKKERKDGSGIFYSMKFRRKDAPKASGGGARKQQQDDEFDF